MAKLKQEIQTLWEENTRLIVDVKTKFKELNCQITSLLEMIKDIKEEVDVDRVVRGHNNHMV